MRPAALGDLEALIAMAEESIGGITSLPPDRDLLQQKITEQAHFFVLEDLESGEVVGCSAVHADGHFHVYRMQGDALQLTRVSEPLSEISSLLLRRDQRGEGMGHLLSRARFLCIAIHPDQFHETIVARMRGELDPEGVPYFWREHIAAHVPLNFEEADLRREEIADLLPPLLPATHASIGKPHRNTAPAVRMLLTEGFTDRGEVDILDAGPILECPRDSLWTAKHRQSGQVRVVEHADGPEVIAATHGEQFRACLTAVQHERQICLPRAAAEALEVADGDWISYRPEAA